MGNLNFLIFVLASLFLFSSLIQDKPGIWNFNISDMSHTATPSLEDCSIHYQAFTNISGLVNHMPTGSIGIYLLDFSPEGFNATCFLEATPSMALRISFAEMVLVPVTLPQLFSSTTLLSDT